jgi:tRNA-splicing ligase RtcB (3'-phosphate/5'-hydroxy nucleic acid ligase)
LDHKQRVNHLGTLGTGNHFIEVCLDESENVWFLLHSGSRGVGNRFGTFFIELAKNDMRQWMINLPDQDLAYLPQGTEHFGDYVRAVHWAQDYALANRELMMRNLIAAVKASGEVPAFEANVEVVSCHHNYVTWEHHYGENVLITRKGAVRAREGDMGIIPGSMGARSYIVRGKGNPESFMSCSHVAGRAMSRTEAKRRFSLDDHAKATAGIECRKDADVIDETPMAYKSIDAVMEAQRDLVDVVHTLRQVSFGARVLSNMGCNSSELDVRSMALSSIFQTPTVLVTRQWCLSVRRGATRVQPLDECYGDFSPTERPQPMAWRYLLIEGAVQ